jgi:hypothetical protein
VEVNERSEITFYGTIEMGGLGSRVELIKGGMQTYGVTENGIFMSGNSSPQYSEWLAVAGTSVMLDGKPHYPPEEERCSSNTSWSWWVRPSTERVWPRSSWERSLRPFSRLSGWLAGG